MKKPIDLSSESIVVRLTNWGFCQRGRSGGTMATKETRSTSPYGGQGYKCMTDVVCNIMKEAANGASPSKTAIAGMDMADAAVIQRAWQRLSIRHQLLLKDLYVLDKPVEMICRQLDIRRNPGHHWNRELAGAQAAIEDEVKGSGR